MQVGQWTVYTGMCMSAAEIQRNAGKYESLYQTGWHLKVKCATEKLDSVSHTGQCQAGIRV